jgi:hypothetical protein
MVSAAMIYSVALSLYCTVSPNTVYVLNNIRRDGDLLHRQVEVTKTIFCQKRGFFSDLRFPSSIGLANGFLSHSKEGGGWSGLVYLCLNLYFLQMFINKYFIAL